ncbi:hypothetical protein [Streptomyces sp. NPDC021622]
MPKAQQKLWAECGCGTPSHPMDTRPGAAPTGAAHTGLKAV